MAALHRSEPRTDGLEELNGREWQETLDYCDRSRISLALRDAAGAILPPQIRDCLNAKAARNGERMRRLEALYGELSARFASAGIEFLALKGITHAALFGSRTDRVQYDIDLFAPVPGVYAARDALAGLGYEAVQGVERFPTDHLAPMVRKTAWEWRGDYFDLEIPTPVELHYQFWDESTERLRAPGTGEFWERRTTRNIAGIELAVLSPPDALAYAALHLLKHVLRGSVHVYHVYELAGFLETLDGIERFWSDWRAQHAPELRRLEAVAFRLAAEWFGCGLPAAASSEIAQLPAATQAWFGEFATAPARSAFDANKDEVWLHWTLLDSRRDAWRVARRRLLPGTLPQLAGANYVAPGSRTWLRTARRWAWYAGHLASRAWHHGLALPRAARSGARWWRRSRSSTV